MSDLDEKLEAEAPLKPRRTRQVKDPVSPFLSAAAPEPAPAPTQPSPPEPPKPAVAEVANVRTRYAMPVFLASQKKVLAPGTVYPVIVDNWVRRQLSLPAGAIVKV
jgi:hypothetical protein